MQSESIPMDALLAAENIRSHVRETPLQYSPYFSELTQAKVWLKLEKWMDAPI